jgi:hypothetical protein
MYDFSSAIATAQRLITKYGQPCYWRRVQPLTNVNPLAPWLVGTGSDIDVPVTILFTQSRGTLTALLQYARNSDVSVGGLRGLMSAQDFTPDLQDVILKNGSAYALQSINPIAPNGTPILYILELLT